MDDRDQMIFTDQTFDNPANNIAFEQMLLEMAEQSDNSTEYLRIWQPKSYMVVLGRGGKVHDDVFLDACTDDGIPVIRRISGGGTIITGVGCLMYTVVLALEKNRALQDITFCHHWVGRQLQQAYADQGVDIKLNGHSDLCVGDKKFSGNAMRMGRSHLIYHGTLLVDFDLAVISRYLKLPPRRPEYREARSHQDFVTNLKVAPEAIANSIQNVFGAHPGQVEWDPERMETLLQERFENQAWNLRL